MFFEPGDNELKFPENLRNASVAEIKTRCQESFSIFIKKKWLSRDDTKESQKASRKSSFVNLTKQPKQPPWWPASARLRRECACANAMIWESLPRTHRCRCNRSIDRDSSAANSIATRAICQSPATGMRI